MGKYEDKVLPFLDQIPEWYKEMTVGQICKKLGVSRTILYRYAKQHPELAKALDNSKEDLVADLRSAIKRRALGYTWEEVQTTETVGPMGKSTTTKRTLRHVPPDLGSAHLLLKNLDPTWRNDDQTTLDMKEREMVVKEKKAEAAEW